MLWQAWAQGLVRVVARLSLGVVLGAAAGGLYAVLVGAVHVSASVRWDRVGAFAVGSVSVGALAGLLGGVAWALALRGGLASGETGQEALPGPANHDRVDRRTPWIRPRLGGTMIAGAPDPCFAFTRSVEPDPTARPAAHLTGGLPDREGISHLRRGGGRCRG
jgi:hypothetical protein